MGHTFSDEVDGVDYSPDAIEGVRQELISLRDNALTQADFHWVADLLSHALAYLSDYKSRIETYNE